MSATTGWRPRPDTRGPAVRTPLQRNVEFRMRNRWSILALLFGIRATMAFQFQSVAAVAPLLGSDFGVGLADIGVLIGLYFAPGIALAVAGGVHRSETG